ncbi:Heme oxygenase (biliverdin-producing) [Bertholletia excelsa]
MSHSFWSYPSSFAALRGLSKEKSINPSPLTYLVSFYYHPTLQFSNFALRTRAVLNRFKTITRNKPPIISCCSDYNISVASPSSSTAEEPEISETTFSVATASPRRVTKKRTRYRKLYPGEKEGITEEMRFVAMKLRNVKGKKVEMDGSDKDEAGDGVGDRSIASPEKEIGETWQPRMKGFLKYLVDSKLVFDTIERIVDESNDVSYAYFRRTGLERSEGLSKDLEWFGQQDIVIPPPSNPGITYAKYLEELGDKSASLFLCHFYNIYFSHIAGGQVITKQVSEKLLKGRELQFYRWEGNAEEILKGVRENLNMLGEHWTRDEKNRCLRETTKSFQYMGQIVRLIIL